MPNIKRILITGGEGQLGRALARRAGDYSVTTMGRAALDVTDWAAAAAIAAAKPDLVVNAAAMTDVDGCEDDPDRAFAVNALGARNVALGAARVGADLVHVSTDYVFDGTKGEPYWEFDSPRPISVYGASKLASERLVAAAYRRVYVVRAAWLYGLAGRSFVTGILTLARQEPELAVVHNQVGSPTFCDDLADGILALAGTGAYGTYHLAGEGACSRFEFARAILDEAGQDDYPLRAIDHFERPAQPPAYAPLRNFAAAQLGIRLPPWRDGLRRFFDRGGGADE
jgi:dTDP-4-dehydrorhamnose reductase